jgi:hypothetical protein
MSWASWGATGRLWSSSDRMPHRCGAEAAEGFSTRPARRSLAVPWGHEFQLHLPRPRLDVHHGALVPHDPLGLGGAVCMDPDQVAFQLPCAGLDGLPPPSQAATVPSPTKAIRPDRSQ